MPNFNIYPWEEAQLNGELHGDGPTVLQPEESVVRLVPSQQLPGFFAPEQFYQSNDLTESTHFCAEYFSYTRNDISVAQISMDENLKLAMSGQQYHITEKAHADLCKILDIPVAFSYSIPTDLTALIVQRLRSLHEQSIVIISRGDTVVSFVDPLKWAVGRGKSAKDRVKKKPHYLPVPNIELLRMLEKVWNSNNITTRVTISDTGMQVEILHQDESLKIEPMVGDVTQIGIVVKSSETGGPLPLAAGYTLRLVCTNGSTVPVQNKKDRVRFSSDWRCKLERRMDGFAAKLRALDQDMRAKCNDLRAAYKCMTDEHLGEDQFYRLYRQAQYISRGVPNSSEIIDGIFGVDSGDRREIFERVRERQRQMRDMTAVVAEPPRSTGVVAWCAFNGITAAARDEVHYHRRVALEGLAGDLMRPYMPASMN